MKKIFIVAAFLSVTGVYFLTSCSHIPEKAKPISDFDANRYLGTWYEIARFDYRFEKNLDNVTAQYSLLENGDIKVFNSGYDYVKNEWKSSTGSARFREDKNTAALKVTFFKPFYSGYNVIALDDNYQYALIAGKNLEYLWLLSREKTMPEEIRNQYLQKAEAIGYDTSRLIWVKQDKDNPLIK